MKKNKLIFITLSIVILLLIFSFSLSCNGSSDNKSSTVKEEETTETVIKGSKEDPYSKNEIVLVEEVQWKLLEVENLGNTLEDPNGFLEDKKSTGSFIKIRFSVKNTGTKAKTLTSLKIVDKKEREFTSYPAFGYVEDNDELFLLDNINPGIEKTYVDIYEIPTDAEGLMLEITSLEFAREKAYIDLGL